MLLTLDDFDYPLPPERIAQQALSERSNSRLLHLDGETFEDRIFRDLPDLVEPGDLLVFNDTRVIHARLHGHKRDTGGRVEVLVERAVGTHEALAQVRASKSPGAGRSEEHTSELQSRPHLVCRLLLEKKKNKKQKNEAPEDDKNLNRSTPIGISTNTYITKIFARCTVKSLVIIMPYVTRDASMMCSRP